MVTTTSWRLVFCSSAASFWVRSDLVASDRIWASSTTRPVSTGNFGAAQAGANRRKNATKAAKIFIWVGASFRGLRAGLGGLRCRRGRRAGVELHHRGGLRRRAGGEGRSLLVALVHGRRPDRARKGDQLGIIILHRGVIVAPRDLDAVLGPFQLGLQRQEVGVGFQVWIILADRHQPAQDTGQPVLCRLELRELGRI